MGVPEDQTTPVATVPDHIPEQKTTHQQTTESASVSSASTINKADEALDEKNGTVTEQEKGKDAEAQDEDKDYPHGLKLVTLITALCLAVFLVALDQTIIATAIPKITDQFNSITDIGWYGSAYFLTSTALQPTFGRIYKVFHIKFVFLTAIAVFEVGSLICAVAPSSTALIVGRAIAGIGVGGIFSGSLIIIAHSGMSPRRVISIFALLTRSIQFR